MTSAVLSRTLPDRIGGPAGLSWQVIAVAYAFTWLMFLAFLPAPEPPEQLLRIVFLTAAQAVMILVLRGARLIVRRADGARAHPWVTVSAYAIASIALTTTLGILIGRQVVRPPAQNTFGYSDTAVAVFVVLVAAAVAVDAVSQYRRQQAELVASHDRLEHVRRVVGDAIDARRQSAIDTVSEQVTDVVRRLGVDSPRETVETLRWAAQDLVRPLSHDLATRNVPFSPTFPSVTLRGLQWASLLADATSGSPIRPIALPLVSSLVTFVYRVNAHGLQEGLVDNVANAVAIGVGAVVANRVMAAVGRRWAVAERVAAMTVALGILGVLGVVAQRAFGSQQGTVATMSANVIITIFIGWVVALLRTVQNQLDDTAVAIATLQEDLEWEIARANQVQWQQQQALARSMHGPVQSAVNAAALRIDAAVREGVVTRELIDAERESILRTLEALPRAFEDRVTDLDLDFRRITGTWAGLCDIEISVAAGVLAAVAADPACASAVTDIVTECCGNAIRHGQAKYVHVVIERSDDGRTISLLIDNDGDPMKPMSETGLGTSLIDDVALAWQREATPCGTRMAVTLPIAG